MSEKRHAVYVFTIQCLGKTKQTETDFVNHAFVPDDDGVLHLDIGKPQLKELQTRYENDINRNRITKRPLLKAQFEWGGEDKLKAALGEGQCWLHPQNPKVVCWADEQVIHDQGSGHKWETSKQANLDAEEFNVAKRVMAKSHYQKELAARPKPGTPLMMQDAPLALAPAEQCAPRQVLELLDSALIATNSTLKAVDPLCAFLLRITPIPDRLVKLVQTLTDKSEEVRDQLRVVEKAPFYIASIGWHRVITCES